MKILLSALVLCAGPSLAQTTFTVSKPNGNPAKGVVVYHRQKQVAKTNEAGVATVNAKIAKGDTIGFYDSWNCAWHIAATNYDKPAAFNIRLQTVEEFKAAKPAEKELEMRIVESPAGDGNDMVMGPPPPLPKERNTSEPVIYEVVDQQAAFPGGQAALDVFVKKYLVHPSELKEKSMQEKCFVKFIVSETGSVSNVRVLRGVAGCPECDQEAVHLVKKMPNWIPAKIGDNPVNSYVILPINFVL